MKKSGWEILVWLNCEQRIGDDPRRIKETVLAYSKAHGVELHPFALHRLEYRSQRKRWRHWHIYCYFITATHVVDVVDAVPFQDTMQGRKWLSDLVDQHFEVFGMPWRMRIHETIYASMVSGGKVALEKLKSSVASFIDSLRAKPTVLNRFRMQLNKAELALNKYYRVVELEDQREAILALNYAVYVLHDLIYDIGETLGLVPVKKLSKRR